MLTRRGGWVLNGLRYRDTRRQNRDFTPQGLLDPDLRPRLPAEAARLCGQLLDTHSEIVIRRSDEAAGLAAAATRIRIARKTYGDEWDGDEITMDGPGGTAVFAQAGGCHYFLSGPEGPVFPAPLDSWADHTGGFLIRDGRHTIILNQKLKELRHLERIAALTRTTVPNLIPHAGAGSSRPPRQNAARDASSRSRLTR